MTLKIFLPACALLGFIAFRSLETSRKLEILESTFSAAGEADFAPAVWQTGSADAWGQTTRIATGGALKEPEVRAMAHSIGRRHQADAWWIEQFVVAYRRTPAREVSAKRRP